MTGETLLTARYALGLDIGDGESALAWTDTAITDSVQIFTRARTGETSVITALARDARARKRLIGDEAVLARGAVQFSVNFKEVPDRNSIATPDVVLFAQELLSEFFAAHPYIRHDCIVYIGHPSGWEKEAVEAYEEHFAALNLPFGLMSESQSALLYVRGLRGGNDAGLDRVVIIDIGSSTTDVTLVQDRTPINLPVGQQLGCRDIDFGLAELVEKRFSSQSGSFRDALEIDGALDLLALVCRRAKEAQFSGFDRGIMQLASDVDPRFRYLVTEATNWLTQFEIPRYVATGGWAERLKAVLEEVRDQLGSDAPPNRIVLTGGGSRMQFLDEIVRDFFPAAQLEREIEPDLAVARGLAANGRHQVRLATFRKEVRVAAASPAVEKEIRSGILALFEKSKSSIVAAIERETTKNIAARFKAIDNDAVQKVDLSGDIVAFRSRLEVLLRPQLSEILRRYDMTEAEFSPPIVWSMSLKDFGGVDWEYFAMSLGESVAAIAFMGTGYGVLMGGFSFLTGSAAAASVATGGAFALFFGPTVVVVTRRREKKVNIRKVKSAELPPEKLQRMVDDLRNAIARQVDAQAQELERFLS